MDGPSLRRDVSSPADRRRAGAIDSLVDDAVRTKAARRCLFREVNERIRVVVGGSELPEFLCECGDVDCTKTAVVSEEDYEAIRRSRSRFLVVPGHLDDDVDHLVEERGHYFVVEAIGAAREVAEMPSARLRTPSTRARAQRHSTSP